ncbi:Cellulose synthase-like protein D2 [Sarracenia purpurea var. burkii]
MAEAASFANLWVPFCHKHDIEPSNPGSYFSLKRDPYKNKVRSDFVKDRRRLKREYDEFKVLAGVGCSSRSRLEWFLEVHARDAVGGVGLNGSSWCFAPLWIFARM